MQYETPYIVYNIKYYKYIACLLETDKLNLGLKKDPKNAMEKWLVRPRRIEPVFIFLNRPI